jgi:steroid 5-alpha reductase family enzyme
MGSQALVYGSAVATTFAMQTIGFIAAYLLKTETFYDIVGGANYLLLALLSAILGATGDGALPWVDDPRKILTTVLFACSRGWLLLFLAWRAHERKGDSRFDEVLGKNGNAPQPLNFFVYWMVQGLWVMLVSMPMLFVNSSNLRKPDLSVYDILCAILYGSGVLIEIVADFQKAMWVKRGRQGHFCDVGVWKYSREI